MGRSSKTRAEYVKFKRTKYKDTGPELVMRELLKEVGFIEQEYYTPKEGPIVFDGYTLEPDIILPNKVLIEVDGHKSHFTKRGIQKRKWRDAGLTFLGYRVIHVPASLLTNKSLQNYAIREILKAIKGDKTVTVIEG